MERDILEGKESQEQEEKKSSINGVSNPSAFGVPEGANSTGAILGSAFGATLGTRKEVGENDHRDDAMNGLLSPRSHQSQEKEQHQHQQIIISTTSEQKICNDHGNTSKNNHVMSLIDNASKFNQSTEVTKPLNTENEGMMTQHSIVGSDKGNNNDAFVLNINPDDGNEHSDADSDTLKQKTKNDSTIKYSQNSPNRAIIQSNTEKNNVDDLEIVDNSNTTSKDNVGSCGNACPEKCTNNEVHSPTAKILTDDKKDKCNVLLNNQDHKEQIISMNKIQKQLLHSQPQQRIHINSDSASTHIHQDKIERLNAHQPQLIISTPENTPTTTTKIQNTLLSLTSAATDDHATSNGSIDKNKNSSIPCNYNKGNTKEATVTEKIKSTTTNDSDTKTSSPVSLNGEDTLNPSAIDQGCSQNQIKDYLPRKPLKSIEVSYSSSSNDRNGKQNALPLHLEDSQNKKDNMEPKVKLENKSVLQKNINVGESDHIKNNQKEIETHTCLSLSSLQEKSCNNENEETISSTDEKCKHQNQNIKEDAECNNNFKDDTLEQQDQNKRPGVETISSSAKNDKSIQNIETISKISHKYMSINGNSKTTVDEISSAGISTKTFPCSDCKEQLSKDGGKEYEEKIQKIKEMAIQVQKLKIGLYLEAIKVHQGSGAERKFSDYWDAFGQYVSGSLSFASLPPSTPNDLKKNLVINSRSNHDPKLNGIEAVLNRFLVTKSLRKKHNAMIKAIMKQCIHNQVLESRVKRHIPCNWKKRIRKLNRPEFSKTRIGEQQTLEQNLLVNDLLQFDSKNIFLKGLTQTNNKFMIQRPPKSSNEPNHDKIGKVSSSQLEETVQNHRENKYLSSDRLPGIIEIDYTSRAALKDSGYSLSSDSLWLVTVAVRDYISKILQNAIKVTTTRETKTDISPDEIKRKRCRVNSFDIVTALDLLKGDGSSFSSRMTWERCISEINLNNLLDANPNLNTTLEEISNMIVCSPKKKQKVAISSRPVNVGKGKNLAAMVVRHQIDEISRRSASSTDGGALNRRSPLPKRNEDISRPPSTITLEQNGKPSALLNLSNLKAGEALSRPTSALTSDPKDLTILPSISNITHISGNSAPTSNNCSTSIGQNVKGNLFFDKSLSKP